MRQGPRRAGARIGRGGRPGATAVTRPLAPDRAPPAGPAHAVTPPPGDYPRAGDRPHAGDRLRGQSAGRVRTAVMHPLSITVSVTPQPPGRTPHSASRRASGTTQPQAPLRCPGGEDTPPEASEAPAREP